MRRFAILMAVVAIALAASLHESKPADAENAALAPPETSGNVPTWIGSMPPNLQTLARAWRVPVSFVRVSPVNNFRQFVAWPQRPPPGHTRPPLAGPAMAANAGPPLP